MSNRFQFKTAVAILVAILVSACAPKKQTETSWKSHFDDAKFLDIQSEHEKAKNQYKLALEKLSGVENEKEWRAEILARLARLEVISGDLKIAEKLSNESLRLTLDPKAQGPNHGEVLIAIDDLAEAYSERSYKSKADRIPSLLMSIKLLDGPFKRPSKVLGRSRAQLAVAYLVNGDKQNAAPLAEIVIEQAKKTGAQESLRELAAGYKIAGEEQKFSEILDIARSIMKEPGREAALMSAYTFEIAKLYADCEKFDQAAKTITDYEKQMKPKRLSAVFYEELAGIYEKQGKLKEADASFDDALEVDRENPAHRKNLRKRMEAYVRYLRRTNRHGKADKLLREADGLREKNY